jgi:hypothetical protein
MQSVPQTEMFSVKSIIPDASEACTSIDLGAGIDFKFITTEAQRTQRSLRKLLCVLCASVVINLFKL